MHSMKLSQMESNHLRWLEYAAGDFLDQQQFLFVSYFNNTKEVLNNKL